MKHCFDTKPYNTRPLLTRRELADLQGALKGDIIMSLEIEATLECVTAREVPATWAR